MKSYILHIIRHGQTESNTESRMAGITESPLTAEGKKVLAGLKPLYDQINPAVAFCSPLSRCVETTKILFPHLTPVVIDSFKEYDFGEWENRPVHEVVDINQEVQWHAFMDGTLVIPGAEESAHFAARVTNALDGVLLGMMKAGVTEAAVVTHGGVMMTLMSLFAYPKASSPLDWGAGNGRGFTVRTNTALWTRDRVIEAVATLPPKAPVPDEDES